MILKVETDNGGWYYIDGISTAYSERGYLAKDTDSQDWYFMTRRKFLRVLTEEHVDEMDITKVNWERYINDSDMRPVSHTGTLTYFNTDHISDTKMYLGGGNKNIASVVFVRFYVNPEGYCREVICGGDVYLMNDEGRTIERL